MISCLWILPAAALGCLLLLCFTDLRAAQWDAALLIFGAGTAIGIGAASCLFFLCRLLVPGVAMLPMLLELALLAGLVVLYLRRPAPAAPPDVSAFPMNLVLGAALLIVLLVSTAAMAGMWDANPYGDWDAWSIWNLRARYMAGDGHLAPRAWSPELAGTHPEYPLLTSSFVARCWVYGGSAGVAAPMAVSYVFLLALLAIAVGGVSLQRTRSLGLLFGLLLAGTPALLHQVPAQYADVPLACYFLATVVFALLDRPVVAGLCAGLAAWTKDEGLLFALLFLAATALWRRANLTRAVLGAAPGTLLMLFFKLALASGTSSLPARASGTLVQKLFMGSRYAQVLSEFGATLVSLPFTWIYLALLALAATLKFDRTRRADLFLAASVAGPMLLAYFFAYIVTPYDLAWHLGSSLERVIAQIWPCLALLLFTVLRAPESYAAVPVPQPARKTPKKR